MKVTDYIVQFLVNKGVNHVFGYPGGVICHFMDSVTKFSDIQAHVAYHEQGAAFAACGYAQASHGLGVAFSTSGPGATNLVTGIANAYFDSTPVLFLTGQVDTYALTDGYEVRQRGFQETNVVDMVKPITKFAIRVDKPEAIKYCLEKAYYIALEGNPGPVLLDLPADVQRADFDPISSKGYKIDTVTSGLNETQLEKMIDLINKSKRPVILLGNGVKGKEEVLKACRAFVNKTGIPTVASLPAFDVLPFNHPNFYGFIGTNGIRYANFVIGKADLILSLGSRLDIRQIGLSRKDFAPNAKLIRVDIDKGQLDYDVNNSEICVQSDINRFIKSIENSVSVDVSAWNGVCQKIKNTLIGYDDKDYNRILTSVSEKIESDSSITLDVGQNQLWFAQSAHLNGTQSVYMSAGHGAMGYSLPAAIGIHYATGKKVYCFCGDGGLMMNVQEMQFVKRERLPIKIICFNNNALGMIRGFQERNFNNNYTLTTESSGYLAPDFKMLAETFGFKYSCICNENDLDALDFESDKSEFIEIYYPKDTDLIPNFGRNGLIQDQMPYLDRDLFNKLMQL